MDYGEVLTRAWQIIWKHKVLWIFGIFAGCSGQGGSTGVDAVLPTGGTARQTHPQDSWEGSREDLTTCFRI
jgi:hypothetical protein